MSVGLGAERRPRPLTISFPSPSSSVVSRPFPSPVAQEELLERDNHEGPLAPYSSHLQAVAAGQACAAAVGACGYDGVAAAARLGEAAISCFVHGSNRKRLSPSAGGVSSMFMFLHRMIRPKLQILPDGRRSRHQVYQYR